MVSCCTGSFRYAWFVMLLGVAASQTVADDWSPPGRNLALNKPYEIVTAGKSDPSGWSEDKGDAVQLTDGEVLQQGAVVIGVHAPLNEDGIHARVNSVCLWSSVERRVRPSGT